MLSDVSDFASQHGLQIVMALAIAVFASLSIAQWSILRRRNTQFTTALNNMTQGLCMWSAAGKLVLCNRRYAEMYELSPRAGAAGNHAS